MKCASNLRQIGLAIQQYASANGDVFPTDFKTLALAGDLTADVFICPSSSNERIPGAQPAEWSATLDEPATHNNSYRYAGRGVLSKQLTALDIIAFELFDDHQNQGINLLFGDGHVDWQTIGPAFKTELERLLADHAAGVRPLRWREVP